MIDISVFSAVTSGLQQAYSSAKALLELKVETETAARINDLAGQLGDVIGKFLSAQTAHVACQERAMKLEQEITRIKAFDVEKPRYAMIRMGEDAIAFALRPAAAGDEPPHHICAHCHGASFKSILQFARYEGRFKVLSCPRCKTEVRAPHGISQEAITVSTGRGVDFRGF